MILRINLLLIATLLYVKSAGATHFRGGSIHWRAVNPASFGGTIEITHRIAWRRDRSDTGGYCSQSTIDSQVLLATGSGNLECREGCTGTIGSMSYYCTDFSISENWSAGERTYIYSIGADVSYFEASFSGRDWIYLVIAGGSASWELRVKGNLTQRSDTGVINTSPISSMPPVIRLQHGCNHTIQIPTDDADGDHVRCRWAESQLQECGEVCQAFPAALTETECTLQYSATGVTGWYAVALQIEDFALPTDSVPLSSIPLQFLVFVFTSNQVCTSRPEFVNPTRIGGSCIGVPFNTTWHEPIIARSTSDSVSIVDIITASPPGLRKSDLVPTARPREWYINATWTPIESQFGPNIFCYSAQDSSGLISIQNCITLLAGVEAPLQIMDSMTPTGRIFPNHTDWSVQFDKQFIRTPRSRYIRIIQEGLGEVFSINAAISPMVTYPQGIFDRTLRFQTDYTFIEKERYYILFDPGVSVGTEFCNAESPAIYDSSVWVVTIADITAPHLQFVNAPVFSNQNLTLSWMYDENATSFCTLQSPASLTIIPCSDNVAVLTNLQEGYHSFFIQGTDTSGNTAATLRHTWRVDLTPPSVRFTITPPPVSPTTNWNFQYECYNEITQCTFMCSFHRVGSTPQYRMCDYTFPSITVGPLYEFAVVATDTVGNVGSPLTYRWRVDTSPPTISTLNDVSLVCGTDFSPAATGMPTATDNEAINPTITYVDQPTSMCAIRRIWTATDNANNSASLAQTISFTNPQPPTISAPSEIAIPCGSVEEVIQDIGQTTLNVTHPCGRPITLSYSDSSVVNRCGFTFTRTWTIQDDCGSSSIFLQLIRVLQQQFPDSPANGQINTRLNEPLLWPQFPGATSYHIFVWVHGTDRPQVPTAVVYTRQYYTSTNFPSGTRMLWQIEYVTSDDNTVPSPVWGFETQSVPDLAVNDIEVPPVAFSGQQFDVSWTVVNNGNRGISINNNWYDGIYIGRSSNFGQSRRVGLIRQRRFVDPSDGYIAEYTVFLPPEDIGNFYVFITTDIYRQIDDTDRSNNMIVSTIPVQVQLTPPPNLIVEEIITPTSSFSGENILIRWRVTNTGLGVTAADRWYDTLLLFSNDTQSTRDESIFVGNYLWNGALGAGQSYDQQVTVSIPNAIFGNYSFIIRTDAFDHVFEHRNEDDNTRISMPPFRVILSPPPDLVVSQILIQSAYNTGDTVDFNYTVENIGAGEPFERFWQDRIIMTMVMTVSNRRYIDTYHTHYGTLEAGRSYSNVVNYVIPSSLPSGTYNVTIYTDYRNHVFEYNADGNNIRWQTFFVNQRLSDLLVPLDGLSVSLEVTPQGNHIVVNYTVQNLGDASTLGSWSDRMSISHTHAYSFQGTIHLQQYAHGSQLLPQQSRIQSLRVFVPRSFYGNTYIHVSVDYNGRIIEANESNNVHTVGPLIVSPIYPDLRVEHFITNSSGNIFAGENVYLMWMVMNVGNGEIDHRRWMDTVYLEESSQITPRSIKLADIALSITLAPSQNYSRSVIVRLPVELFGTYNLILSINNNRAVNENNSFLNNSAVIPIYLNTPPSPDFRVLDVSVSYFNIDRIIVVEWMVQNAGNSLLSGSIDWIDSIYLHTDSMFNLQQALFIGSQLIAVESLESQQSYTVSQSIHLPVSIQGTYFVYVEVDSGNAIMEVNAENNNFGQSLETVIIGLPPVPRLVVQIRNRLPDTVVAGDTYMIEYEVINVGDSHLSLVSWTDGVFLTSSNTQERSEIIESGTPLAQLLNNRQLDRNESYVGSINITIPYGYNQQIYLAVLIDLNNNLDDTIIPDENARYVFANHSIMVEQGPLPDLIIVTSFGSLDLQGGQPATLTYDVINIGENRAFSVWYDSIYLSIDAYIDPFDTKLKSLRNKVELGINDSYSQTVDVFIPFDLPSASYYIFYEADASDTITELNSRNNFIYQIVNVTEAISTDLLVTDVSASPMLLGYGDVVAFDWNLRNNGTVQAHGYKCDTAYLSSDNVWDITDLQLGNALCGFVTIEPHLGNSNNDLRLGLQASTPFVAQTNYTGFVRTRSNIRDPSLENNIGFTNIPLSIRAPILSLGSPTVVAITPGEELVYRIDDIPSDKTLIATLTTTASSAYHNLFLRYKYPPTGFNFDAFSKYSLSSNQTTVLRNTRAGEHYLRIESVGYRNEPYQIEVLVKIARFEILSISPDVATFLGNVTIRFSGTVFSNFLQAELVHEATNLVSTALEVYWFTSEDAYATFDASALPSGIFTARLVDLQTGSNAQLNNSFTIVEGLPGHLSVQVRPPRPLRAGSSGMITVTIENDGNSNLLVPLMILQTGGSSFVRLLHESVSADSSIQYNFIPIPSDGPGGILRPGEIVQLEFEVTPQDNFVGSDRLTLSYVQNLDDSHFYFNKKDQLKPPHISTTIWDVIWDNFIESVGTTWGSLNQRISEVATQLSLSKQRVFDINSLIDYQLGISYGLLSGGTILSIQDIAEENSDSFLALTFNRRYSSYIYKRRSIGSNGLGWILPWWEVSLQNITNNEVWLLKGRDLIVFETVEDQNGLLRSSDGELIFATIEGYVYNDNEESEIYTFNSANGKLTSIESALDNSSITVQYVNLFPVTFHHSNGKRMNVTYTDEGLINSVDILGRNEEIESTSFYTYDDTHSLLNAVTVGESVTTFMYNDQGDLETVNYADGSMQTLDYDTHSLLTQMSSFSSSSELIVEVSLQRDWNGKVLMTVLPSNKTVQIGYGTSGEPLLIVDEGGVPMIITQSLGRQRLFIGDQEISNEFNDSTTNVLHQMDLSGRQEAYKYGDNQELLSFTDSSGYVYGFEYDEQNRLAASTLPDGNTTRYRYNIEDLLATLRNPDGTEIHYSYDSDYQMINKNYPNVWTSYEYDNNKRLIRGTNSEGTIGITYDTSGRPVQVSYSSGHILYYGYNNQDQRVFLADNNGYNVTYIYDRKEKLSQIRKSSSGEVIVEYQYDETDKLTRKNLGNGAYTIYRYNGPKDQLSELRNFLPGGEESTFFTYEYDKLGRIISATSESGRWKYIYDSAGQLIKWMNPELETTEITYDLRGNRLQQMVDGSEMGYSVNSVNQYLTFNGTELFSYNENGHLREKRSGRKRESFIFDAEGKLIETETLNTRCSYKYDALGNLFQKNCSDSSSFEYLVDPFGEYGANIVAEISANGIMHFVHSTELGLVAAISIIMNTSTYYEFDGIGSVVSMTNESGAVKNIYKYDPFGKVIQQSEQIRNLFKYIGQLGVISDGELQDIYMMRDRHYDAQHGRFISLDPIGIAGNNPNFYVYAYNSPLMLKDPTGRILPIIAGVIVRHAVGGAVVSAATYSITSAITGDFSYGGLAGAAISGAIMGPSSALRSGPIRNAVLPVAGAVAGTFSGNIINNKIEGKRWNDGLDYGEAVTGSIWNLAWANVPSKLLGPLSRVSDKYVKNAGWFNAIKPIFKQAGRFLNEGVKKFFKNVAKSVSQSLASNAITNLARDFIDWIRALDPNDILGPDGFGDAHFVAPNLNLEYTIRFENDPNATAPAQRVFISHILDNDLDARSFRLGSFGFGDFARELSFRRAFVQEVVNVTETHRVYVRIRAGIDVTNQEATWEFQAIDPETGEEPVDPTIGFLPPNNGTTGQGFVTFRVRVTQDVETLSRIDAEANIFFDQNEPIATPPIFNTIDKTDPELNLTVNQELLQVGSLILHLGKSDVGSGVASVDIYKLGVSDGIQAIEPILLGTTEDAVMLPLADGSAHRLIASAVDNVGNRQPLIGDVMNNNIIVIDIPVVVRPCINNCSARGNCSNFGICVCESGYYGNDCSLGIPPIEPPVLEITTPRVPLIEGTPITILLVAHSSEAINTTEGVYIHVSGFPDGSYFNKGYKNGSVWIFNATEFGEIELILPSYFSGDVDLFIIATYNGASRENLVHFTVEPVTNPPILIVGEACFDNTTNITLPIQVSLVDNDDSENLTVIIWNIPSNVHLAVGEMTESGQYVITSNILTRSSAITLNFNGHFEPFDINISAVSVEIFSGQLAYTNISISIDVCEGRNECREELDNCDQICVDTQASYVCSCLPGYILDTDGFSCTSLPPVEPPVLEITTPRIPPIENIPITISLFAYSSGRVNTTEGVYIHVSGFPEGSYFNKGYVNGSIWIFNATEFGEVELTLPMFFSGDVALLIVAAIEDFSQESLVNLTVEAAADPPVLIVGETCSDNTTNITLPIQSFLVDNDGSENLTVVIWNIPSNVHLTVGEMTEVGQYIITAENLVNSSTITLVVIGAFEPFDINISAISIENSNGQLAYTNMSVSIDICKEHNECKENLGNCDQICVDTQTSYICSCNPGYILLTDGYSCTNIDECALGIHGCDQVCRDSPGSYTCSCNAGYDLSADGFTCMTREKSTPEGVGISKGLLVVIVTIGSLVLLALITILITCAIGLSLSRKKKPHYTTNYRLSEGIHNIMYQNTQLMEPKTSSL